MRLSIPASVLVAAALASGFAGQAPKQPKVAPGPNEPDWAVVLEKGYGVSMFGDLLNPVKDSATATPGLFRKAGPGPVTCTPVIALGLETVNRGGWYRPGADHAHPEKVETWSYRFKHKSADFASGRFTPPPLAEGSRTTFDPGDKPFGLWVANDGLADSDAYTEPAVVQALNKRLAKQPYKAMIFPFRDKATGKVAAHCYLIGFEYSTNDDFQDIVCKLENVELVPGP